MKYNKKQSKVISNPFGDTEIDDQENYLKILFEDTIGNNVTKKSPFGHEINVVYNDYTASGKALKHIEEFISRKVLPLYANVHTTIGYCAEQTTNLLKESKHILREYVNAWGDYSIIFHGQGTTGGIHKLIELLKMKQYAYFYQKLESLALMYQSMVENNNHSNFERDAQDLIEKVYKEFIELFIKTNFCYKEFHKDECFYKCVLCDQQYGSEGQYHSHEESSMHKKKEEEFYENPEQRNIFQSDSSKKILFDYIDKIRCKKIYQYDLYELIKDYKKFQPIVFVTLYEHNSNKLSWLETGAKIITVNDENQLITELNKYNDYYIKIGSFSSGSNITGILVDVDKFAIIMHKYNGFAFFDYATSSPYLKIDMREPLPDDYRRQLNFDTNLNKEDLEKYCYKDGIFFSPHKFLGGVNTPGIVIVHNKICRNNFKPCQPGGGTVNYVLSNDINYVLDIEAKEESGTPNIIGGIRVGLTIKARSQIDHYFILKKEDIILKKFNEKFQNKNKNIFILDNDKLKNKSHIPIYSFLIPYHNNKFFHPCFISVLLNDLFGIQSRPGCSCAPTYGQLLLGVAKNKYFKEMKAYVHNGVEIFKPGFCRLNLPYFYPLYIIDYVLNSIEFICDNAYIFFPFYEYDINSSVFWHYKYKCNFAQINKCFNCKEKIDMANSHLNSEGLSQMRLNDVYETVKDYLKSDKIVRDIQDARNNLINKKYDKLNPIQDKIRWFVIHKDTEKDLDNFIASKEKKLNFYNNPTELDTYKKSETNKVYDSSIYYSNLNLEPKLNRNSPIKESTLKKSYTNVKLKSSPKLRNIINNNDQRDYSQTKNPKSQYNFLPIENKIRSENKINISPLNSNANINNYIPENSYSGYLNNKLGISDYLNEGNRYQYYKSPDKETINKYTVLKSYENKNRNDSYDANEGNRRYYKSPEIEVRNKYTSLDFYENKVGIIDDNNIEENNRYQYYNSPQIEKNNKYTYLKSYETKKTKETEEENYDSYDSLRKSQKSNSGTLSYNENWNGNSPKLSTYFDYSHDLNLSQNKYEDNNNLNNYQKIIDIKRNITTSYPIQNQNALLLSYSPQIDNRAYHSGAYFYGYPNH